jgi:hypothetical protein
MPNLFDALASDVHAALADDARPGTLRREISGGLDEYGDPLPGTVETYSCLGWREEYEAAFLAAGIPTTDVRVVVLAQSLSTTPQNDDQIGIEGSWWQVRSIQQDPAVATYSLQCFEISDPT